MNWFTELFLGGGVMHSCIIIALVCAVGIVLGKIKIFGISLGISFVFFVGIMAGHFSMNLDPVVAEFAQSFGLCLFVFTLGLQVGPSFFTTLRSGGLMLNILSISVLALNIVMVLLISSFASIPITQMVGVLSGAVTNTPSLGAAQQSLVQSGAAGTGDITDMALACAVTYPFGVVGAILVIAALNIIAGKTVRKSASITPEENEALKPFITGVMVKNEVLSGVKIGDLRQLTDSKIIVTRVIRNDAEINATAQTQILVGDKMVVTVAKTDKDRVIEFIGDQWDINWSAFKSELVSRKIFVTKSDVNGKSIEALKIRKDYNVNITRVNRSGIYLIAQNDLKLFVGDRVVLVGEQKDVKRVEELLGNAMKKIDEPHLVTIFTGIVLGLILGSVPILIPGVSIPIKMGLAGGTIIVGILMGAFGYRFKFNTYTTISANLMLREVGIVMYLSALGIASGGGFFHSLVSGNGLQWLMWGALITVVPIILIGLIAIKLLKRDVPTVLGMLCGSMANPPALSYTTEVTAKNSPAIAYATVYPLTMFLRVVSAQILVMLAI